MSAEPLRRPSSRPRDARTLDRVLLLVCGLVLGLTVAYPCGRLLWRAVHDWQGAALVSGDRLAALRNTAVLSLASVATSGAVGTALALWLARYAFPGRRALAGLAYLPFTLPPLVGVLSFYYLVGPDGFLPRAFAAATGLDALALEGPWGILLIHTYSFYVFFYAMVAAAAP